MEVSRDVWVDLEVKRLFNEGFQRRSRVMTWFDFRKSSQHLMGRKRVHNSVKEAGKEEASGSFINACSIAEGKFLESSPEWCQSTDEQSYW